MVYFLYLFFLIQIILGTLISYFAQLKTNFKVDIVGDVPTGYVNFSSSVFYVHLVYFGPNTLMFITNSFDYTIIFLT